MFFFFKQKTAYEMRISDWSSDVCSSDLEPTLVVRVDGSLGDGGELVLADQAFVLHPVDDVHLEPRMQRARILPHQFLDQPRAVLGREVRDSLAELPGACVVAVGKEGHNAGLEDLHCRLPGLLVPGGGD